jgi:hypothetical protein
MNPQVAEALQIANSLRCERARQRRALSEAPPTVLVPALINPTPELGKYKLETLFGATPRGHGFIRGVGRAKLKKALLQVESKSLRRGWHTGLRLEELTERERRLLVRELLPKVAA